MGPKTSFVDRLMGVSRVDNASNPKSALNRAKTARQAPVTKQTDDMRQHLEYVNRNVKSFGKGWGG